MAIQNTDLFIVQRSGVQYKMTANEVADFVGAVRDYTALNIADRNSETFTPALGAEGLKVGDRVFVTDASADLTVNSSWAVYRVQSIAPTVYEKIQEQESMDLTIITVVNLSYTASGTQGVIVNDSGDNAVIPSVTSSNAGLATPAILLDTHKKAFSGLTTATNPINIDSTTQEVTFNIDQLDSLP